MTGGGRVVLLATLLTVQLMVSLSAAFNVERRGGSAADLEDLVSRDQLISAHKKEMNDEVSFRRLRELVQQLTTRRRRSEAKLELKSREPDVRRAAFDDEDPLHILLGNERPESSRVQKDDRTLQTFGKRKQVAVANKRSDAVRPVERKGVDGPFKHQRQVEPLNRPSRFMDAIGLAPQPSYGGGSSDSFGGSYGSQGWGGSSNDNYGSDDSGSYEWVEVPCEENDPDPQCNDD